MKKILLILLLLPLLAAAKVPDEEGILNRTMDPASPFYYANLMLRYNAGDLTLTEEDYHYLYYGYALQESYKPLSPNADFDRALMIAARIDADKPLVEDVEKLISATTDALRQDPFSPKMLNLMAFAYGALGDKVLERAYYDKTRKVIATIQASGDGLTQKSPRHILMFDHALDVLTSEGHPYAKSRVVSRTVEYVPLLTPYRTAEQKIKGYYFDFGRVYRNKPEGYTYKRDRTWQFNNLKPREYK